jgi:hypothetical protein
MALYKYMSAEVAPLFTRTLKVRFTQPFELNDPFEFRPLINIEGTTDELRATGEAEFGKVFDTVDGALAAIEEVLTTNPNLPLPLTIPVLRQMLAKNPTLREEFMSNMQRQKAEAFDRPKLASLWEAHWENFRQSVAEAIGIFSLTEDPAHILMWSHYASEHFGIAVEFDDNHPWFSQRVSPSDDLRQLVQVSYVQNPHPRTWKQLNADVLYTKRAEWAYEREWRIIRPLQDGTEVSPGKFCFDVPPDAVRSITFGCRTTLAVEQEIRRYVATNPSLSHVCFKRVMLTADGKIEVEDAPPVT